MSSLAELAPAESDLLRKAGAGPPSHFDRQSVLGRPASNAFAPPYIMSGWAAHVRELGDGRRQLIHILLPGDPMLPPTFAGERQAIACITVVQAVDGEAIRNAARDPIGFPGIAAAVAMAAAQERAFLMEHVVRLGRQTAYERVASLFVELYRRCATVGLATGEEIPFPLTQECLGDLLGLSMVHVNRTLQLFRREGLIELRHGRLKLPDLSGLTAVADG